MNTGTAQIADLLLGIAPPSGGVPSGAGGGEKGASLFGDVISGMMRSSQLQGLNVDNLLMAGDSVLEKNDNPILNELLQQIIHAGENEGLLAVQDDVSTVYPADNQQSVQGKTPHPTQPGAVALMPLQAPLSSMPVNEFVRDIIDGNITELQPGRYEVQNITFQGDTVQLDVSPLDKTGTAIRISLPSDKLISGMANSQQVAVAGQERAVLENYLAKLDVKELVITINNTTSHQTAISPDSEVGVEIIAVNAGQLVSLKARMTQRDINARTQLMTTKNVSADNTENTLLSVPSFKPIQKLESTTQSELDWFNKQNTWDNKSKHTQLMEVDAGSSQSGVINAQLTGHNTESTVSSRMIPQTVRFTLPDNLATTLRPNGHSIQLRIEPEHLGPARLSLTLQHNRLRAVVTVETHQAQAILERSLDKLHNTLSQAGVQVDYIDVNVDPRQSGDQLFRQDARPDYKRVPLSSLSMIDGESDMVQNTISVSRYSPASYINTNGLNILA